MPTIRNIEIARPTVEPVTSSILDHARAAGNFKGDLERFGLRNNAGLWPSYNCLEMNHSVPTCPDPNLDAAKTFESAPWVPGFEIAVQGGVECSLVGLDLADQKAEVLRVFGNIEGKGIERALRDNRFVARVADTATPGNLRDLGEWDAPDDITAGLTVNLKQAIALLEGYAAANYAGLPTIHMPRAAVSMISDMVQWRGDLAFTPAGSKVAVGGGYDDEAMLLSGKWDLYATGEVYIEADSMLHEQQQVIPGDGSLARVNREDNMAFTLVERQYRIGIDCFVAKAVATVF